MARIPTVTAQTSPFAGTIDVQASGENFGAQIGAEKIGLGNAIGQLGSAVTSVGERFAAEGRQRQAEADQLTVATALASPEANFDKQYNDITVNSPPGTSSPIVSETFLKHIDTLVKTRGLTGDAERKFRIAMLARAQSYNAEAIAYDENQKIKLGINDFTSGLDAQINSIRTGGGAEATSPGIDPVTKKPIPSRYDIAVTNGINSINAQPGVDAATKALTVTKFKSDAAAARFEALGEAALADKTDAPSLADAALEDFRTNPRWKADMTKEAYDATLQKLLITQKQSRTSIEVRMRVKLSEYEVMKDDPRFGKVSPQAMKELGTMVEQYGDESDLARLHALEIAWGTRDKYGKADNATLRKGRDAATTGGPAPPAPGHVGDPTNFLLGKLSPAHRNQPYYITSMNPQLQTNLAALIQSAPPEIQERLIIVSGARSRVDQGRVIKNAGGVSGRVAGLNGPHVRGVAADLGWRGAQLGYFPPGVVKWLTENAPKYSLAISPQAPTPGTANYEAHHIELVGPGGQRISSNMRGGGGGTVSGGTLVGGDGGDTLSVAAAGTPVSYRPMFEATAKYDPRLPALLAAQAAVESGFNPNARGGAGEIGMMQFMPETARRWKVNPGDPASAVDGAGRMMQHLLQKYAGKSKGGYNDVALALAAYNAGEGRVDMFLIGRGNIPGSTQQYIQKVLGGQGGALDASERGMGTIPVVDAGDAGGEPGQYITYDQFVKARTFQDMIDENDKAMKTDFIGYAVSKGADIPAVVDPTTSTMADDTSWKDRGTDYLSAVNQHQPVVSKEQPYADFFTQDEMKGLEPVVQGNDERAQLALTQHIAAMDPKAQAAAYHQLGKYDAVFAYAGGLAAKDPRAAATIFHGRALANDQNLNAMGRAGGKEQLERLYDATVGSTFSRDLPELQGARKQAAIAAYIAKQKLGVLSDNVDVKVQMDPALMIASITLATGLVPATVNNATTFLPPDVNAKDVDAVLKYAEPETYTTLSKNGKPPLTIDPLTAQSRVLDPSELDQEATLQVASTDGRYFLQLPDGEIAFTSELDKDGVPRPYVMVLTHESVAKEAADARERGRLGIKAEETKMGERTGVTGLGSTEPIQAEPVEPMEPNAAVPGATPTLPPGSGELTPETAPAGSMPPSALPPASAEPATAAAVPPEITPAEGTPPTPYIPPYASTPLATTPTAPPFVEPTGEEPYEPQVPTRAGGPVAPPYSSGSGTGTATTTTGTRGLTNPEMTQLRNDYAKILIRNGLVEGTKTFNDAMAIFDNAMKKRKKGK